jgi:hypothetical protein
MQLAGRGIDGTGPAMDKQSVGQISQHKPQPVHFVSSTTGTSRHSKGGCGGCFRFS